jgi:hypothetical protein
MSHSSRKSRTAMCSCRLPTHICSRLTLISAPRGARGPPGASGSTVASCTRNIRRSGNTGMSNRSILRLTCSPLPASVSLQDAPRGGRWSGNR